MQSLWYLVVYGSAFMRPFLPLVFHVFLCQSPSLCGGEYTPVFTMTDDQVAMDTDTLLEWPNNYVSLTSHGNDHHGQYTWSLQYFQ